jgi:sterol 24-C-methyltransferase
MVNHYYDLVTDFYEYGWGQSFHFAPRWKGETFNESIVRHEHYLAAKLQLKPGQVCVDIGCGVGGPLRNMVRFSGAKVIGLNNNEYQVKRTRRLNEIAGLSALSDAVHGDFMKLPFTEKSFDAAYAIEATCHAPDRVACYQQVWKVLKEGGYFGLYEWGMTDKYDEKSEEHRLIKHGIEEGNGLPTLAKNRDIVEAARKAGFEVLETADLAVDLYKQGSVIGWNQPLKGGWGNLRGTTAGRMVTHVMVNVLETIKIAPKGTVATSAMLNATAQCLIKGGDSGTFTPMLFILCRKPVTSKSA